MEVKSRAPSVGYSSAAKQSYRESVWWSLLGQPISGNEKTLILPSKDGEEIDYLISKGVLQKDIICIDENPALIATAPWRKKYKSIKAYGCKLSKVGERLKKDGVTIGRANLDLCNNFSEELVSEVSSFLNSGATSDKDFHFSITVSKGRESSVVNYLMNMLMGEDDWRRSDYCKLKEKRIACLMRIASKLIQPTHVVRLLHEGDYIHHKTPMAYACFSINNLMESKHTQPLFEMVRFEKSLYDRCNILGALPDGYWQEMSRCDPANVLINTSNLNDLKKYHPKSYQMCVNVLSGEYDQDMSIVKLMVLERLKIYDFTRRFFEPALDVQGMGRGQLDRWMDNNGPLESDHNEAARFLNIFEFIKNKFNHRAPLAPST